MVGFGCLVLHACAQVSMHAETNVIYGCVQVGLQYCQWWSWGRVAGEVRARDRACKLTIFL